MAADLSWEAWSVKVAAGEAVTAAWLRVAGEGAWTPSSQAGAGA